MILFFDPSQMEKRIIGKKTPEEKFQAFSLYGFYILADIVIPSAQKPKIKI